MIIGNVIGAIIKSPDTLVLMTEGGNEYTAVMTAAEDAQITATADDIRLGKTAALERGIVTGARFIPSYPYHYATINANTGLCTSVADNNVLVPIMANDSAYVNKYYNKNDNKWYEDSAFTTPWQYSST